MTRILDNLYNIANKEEFEGNTAPSTAAYTLVRNELAYKLPLEASYARGLLLLLLKSYQYFISPLLGNNCRFHPTCSEYAKEAIITHGNIKGSWLAFKRIIRCQPFCDGGYDAVPSLKNK